MRILQYLEVVCVLHIFWSASDFHELEHATHSSCLVRSGKSSLTLHASKTPLMLRGHTTLKCVNCLIKDTMMTHEQIFITGWDDNSSGNLLRNQPWFRRTKEPNDRYAESTFSTGTELGTETKHFLVLETHLLINFYLLI